MPKAMNFPLGSEAWTPLVLTTDDITRQRGAHYLSVVGRVRPGALPAARAEVAAIAERLAAQYPRTNGGSRVSIAPLRTGIVGDAVAPGMRLLLGAVGLVFLVACVNVSSLVLGMSLGRRPRLRRACGPRGLAISTGARSLRRERAAGGRRRGRRPDARRVWHAPDRESGDDRDRVARRGARGPDGRHLRRAWRRSRPPASSACCPRCVPRAT